MPHFSLKGAPKETMNAVCNVPAPSFAMLSESAKALARQEAEAAKCRGLLCTSEEAWAAAGKGKVETHWSIALRVAMRSEESAEDLCEYLEAMFPLGHIAKRKLDPNATFHGEKNQI